VLLAAGSWTGYFDRWVGAILAPLAMLILAGGIDDLLLIFLWLLSKRHSRRAAPADSGEKPIAVFVPLWKEHEVIGGMLDHNIHAIRYRAFHFFVGAYPNDEKTVLAVRDAEARHARVHLALCPHEGPTSKADCLNWIYQRMLLYEEREGTRFELVVIHDAEDLIHPESLRVINRASEDCGMVQVPVLPLRTPLSDVVHGVYIDEFSEYQMKDMPARQTFGSFMPSNGVGTGFRRDALERLAETNDNRVFDPGCLTEDYEIGLRIHRMGLPQCFIPLAAARNGLVATRELFPRGWRTAVRQRTRWITGIALQGWERNGWRGGWRVAYWFWRDRKGLLTCPLGLLTNLIVIYGGVTWAAARLRHAAWGLAQPGVHPFLHSWMVEATLGLAVIQIGFRAGSVASLYGWKHAACVPLRIPAANLINCIAAFRAMAQYASSRIHKHPLVWVKTEHAYPSREALLGHKRKLGEVLVTASWISQDDLDLALRTQPTGVRLGEHLVALGKIEEDDLYDALSLQQGLPAAKLAPDDISPHAARALPRRLLRQWKVLPYQIDSGELLLASPEIPSDEMARELSGCTRLSLRFHLMTPRNFRQLNESIR
jgi:adsorption protein B